MAVWLNKEESSVLSQSVVDSSLKILKLNNMPLLS